MRLRFPLFGSTGLNVRRPRNIGVLGALVATLAIGLITFELFLRSALGLGSPPLSIPHPKIEYMFKPNQELRRFHNYHLFNEYGMRSPFLATSDHQRLVLAFGDSVLNGGSLTDQDELATTIASSRLSAHGTETLVGNVSAGSWGPGNIRGWIETFGLLGADTIILVLSSHDISDQPTFAPLDPTTHPTEPPPLALVEAVVRYLPRYLPSRLASWVTTKPLSPAPNPSPVFGSPNDGIADLEWILDFASKAGVKVCLVQHLTRGEIIGKPELGYELIKSIFASWNIPRVDDARWIAPNLNAEPNPFRDDIHISSAGQVLLAEALIECDQLAAIPAKMAD